MTRCDFVVVVSDDDQLVRSAWGASAVASAVGLAAWQLVWLLQGIVHLWLCWMCLSLQGMEAGVAHMGLRLLPGVTLQPTPGPALLPGSPLQEGQGDPHLHHLPQRREGAPARRH